MEDQADSVPERAADEAAGRQLLSLETTSQTCGPSTAAFVSYLRLLTGGRGWPRRSDVQPTDMVGFLPNVFIADIVDFDPLDIRFRLVGTGITAIEGEITGQLLSELVPDRQQYAKLWQQYASALAGQIWLRRESLDWQGRGHITYEVLVVPMRDDSDDIAQFLGVASGY